MVYGLWSMVSFPWSLVNGTVLFPVNFSTIFSDLHLGSSQQGFPHCLDFSGQELALLIRLVK